MRTFEPATITAWVVAPAVVMVATESLAGTSAAFYVKPRDVGAWAFEAQMVLTRNSGTGLVGARIIVEREGNRVVALWDQWRMMKVSVPLGPAEAKPAAEQVKSALAWINRTRVGVQPPLEFGPVTWCSSRVPVEPWSDEDIVEEARRLGRDG